VGHIVKGPGATLYEFLKSDYAKANPPILIVNYANFTASEIVGLNALLDQERRADGIAVPEDVHVIGFINKEAPGVYTGSDFYSRFDKRYLLPVKDSVLQKFLNKKPIKEKDNQVTYTKLIDLYHGADWKSQLLGQWVMTADGLRFEEGLLKAAIRSGKTIEIKNGLWDDPEFTFFWQQLRLLGELRHNGQSINTKDLDIVKSEGYDWEGLKKFCALKPSLNPGYQILNPSKLGDCFCIYDYSKSCQALLKGPGLIKKAGLNGQKTLELFLTRTLSVDEWARLLSQAKKNKIILEVKLAEGVELPKELEGLAWNTCRLALGPTKTIDSTPDSIMSQGPIPMSNKVQIFECKDRDSVLALITAQDPLRVVIEVTECKASDLLVETKPLYDKKKLKLKFNQQKCALLKALEKGQHVVLIGTFSPELADELAHLILSMQDKPREAQGQLSIITDNVKLLNYIPKKTVHIQEEQKQGVVFQSRILFADGWRGLQQLEYDPNCLGRFNPETSQAETLAFNKYRSTLVFNVLSKSPYVFIAGLSGVGKSTFVEKELLKGSAHKLYHGECSLEKWALDQSSCPKFLFIDEANLSPNQWSQFEGLFYNNPPSILINGQLRSLSPQHMIIFAGNPVNYGDDRRLAPFFERHGRAVVFDPLPLPVIFEQILKPVLANTLVDSKPDELCAPFFDIYAFLCAQSTTEILISPRELQMMALLTACYCRQVSHEDPQRVAKHYAYKLAKPLVPAVKLALFEQKFGKTPPPLNELPLPLDAINAMPAFKATPSRLPVLHRLHELLMLHDLRAHSATQNDAIKFGGLGGVSLEGDSSVGKSALVIALLRAHGFEEVHNVNLEVDCAKPFYRMEVSMSSSEKEKLLIWAFYEGAVVVIDEINSSPMMERLLNDLLMGKVPAEFKIPKKEIKPGFMIIGTQNPVALAGRRAASTALSRRLSLVEVPNYPRQELLDIIKGSVVYSRAANEEFELLVDAFIHKSAEAKQRFYTPAPTLRQVLKEADLIKLQYRPQKNPKAAESRFSHFMNYLKESWCCASIKRCRSSNLASSRQPKKIKITQNSTF
jgi:hypothetical protein